MNVSTTAVSASRPLAAQPSTQVQAELRDAPLLTRVSLVHVEDRINLYLRFGHPVREQRLDRWWRCATFLPGARFARIRWEANDYGTTRWQLMVLQACTPRDAMQRIAGIRPGAHILLHVEGERWVQAVLAQMDAIEALGIDPTDVSPAYWRTLDNRLAARMPAPSYTLARHAAWLTGRALQ